MGRKPYINWQPGSDDLETVSGILAKLGLSDLSLRKMNTLSGGQRQKVMVGRALAQDPNVLLLDEPTSDLDIRHQLEVMDVIREEIDRGLAGVLAIHDLNLAARYCDELAVLAEGQKRVSGPPGEVLTAETIEATFGGEPLVTTQPATDAPLVTVLSEQEAAETHVHLVGTGTYAARAIEGLRTEGFTVSTGVLPTVDVAAERARKLDCRVVTVPAFAGIDEQAQERASELAREADAVVVVGEIHPENQAVVDAGRQVFEIGATDPGAVDADSLTSGGGLAGVPERIAKTDLKDN
jgi:iron complex transport system ATP-binding protein